MGHPQMFDPDDPLLERVRSIATDLPGAEEKVSHGRPAFFTKKVFAYYGGSRVTERGHEQHPHAVVVLVDGAEREALLGERGAFIPAYLGPAGWLGVDLSPDSDFDEVAELIESSFRNTAPKRLVALLDAGYSPP